MADDADLIKQQRPRRCCKPAGQALPLLEGGLAVEQAQVRIDPAVRLHRCGVAQGLHPGLQNRFGLWREAQDQALGETAGGADPAEAEQQGAALIGEPLEPIDPGGRRVDPIAAQGDVERQGGGRQRLAGGRRQRFEGGCSLRAGQQLEGHRQGGGVVVQGGHGVEVASSLASVSPSIRRWRACAEASGSLRFWPVS